MDQVRRSANDDGGVNRVFLVHPDGTDFRFLTGGTGALCCPAWSPDSTQLIVSGITLIDLDSDASARIVYDQVSDYAYWWAPLP